MICSQENQQMRETKMKQQAQYRNDVAMKKFFDGSEVYDSYVFVVFYDFFN